LEVFLPKQLEEGTKKGGKRAGSGAEEGGGVKCSGGPLLLSAKGEGREKGKGKVGCWCENNRKKGKKRKKGKGRVVLMGGECVVISQAFQEEGKKKERKEGGPSG